jgi:hypothetical protein
MILMMGFLQLTGLSDISFLAEGASGSVYKVSKLTEKGPILRL